MPSPSLESSIWDCHCRPSSPEVSRQPLSLSPTLSLNLRYGSGRRSVEADGVLVCTGLCWW
ncbi:hypothetical protein Hanom_Chr04g00345751 [Helianthus anomalus]